MSDRPVIVVAAIAEFDGRFLVVEESIEGRAVFNQPAGHLEHGETLVEAVRREVLEETAWRFEPDAVVGLYRYAPPGTPITYLRVCFAGRALEHEPERKLDVEILRAAWMTREELAASRGRLRSPLVLRCVDDYLAGRRYPLELLGEVG